MHACGNKITKDNNMPPTGDNNIVVTSIQNWTSY